MANPNVAHGSPTLNEAIHEEGLPRTGTEAVEGAHGSSTGANHPDPTALGLNATAWVSAAMLLFLLVLVVKGVPALIGRLLDGQIAAIRTRLDEARTLRAEAEALRDEYTSKIAGIEAQAAEMVAHAEAEAQALLVKAEADAAELTQRRAKMATDKIAAAERAAIAEVRATAADAAAKAAGALIATHLSGEADRALVDRTIAGLGGSRLN
ncbi:F0F1 ATP synthase subunit B [uncultured Sphingomonas sp.]|uniref:F0F1 ATP synthase subunit B family protein n=1 Tax=uncultured Sphingomonas sp. TaxID=158754 RepID=UPI0025857DF8|nr:F0F1 ATP synthase subunit B [uncultured Sphingomonas sp.]